MTPPVEGNRETILLVEDNPTLLRHLKQILEDANFTVIAANSAKQALRLEAEFPGTIDLLLSAVALTGTSGPKLAERLKDRRPRMRMVLMAGFPGGALLILNYGWHYIERPLVSSVLVNRIKDVLRGEAREQSTHRFDTLKVPRRSFGRTPVDLYPLSTRQARRRA
jgi:DNA-binding response OmpR family regulator